MYQVPIFLESQDRSKTNGGITSGAGSAEVAEVESLILDYKLDRLCAVRALLGFNADVLKVLFYFKQLLKFGCQGIFDGLPKEAVFK